MGALMASSDVLRNSLGQIVKSFRLRFPISEQCPVNIVEGEAAGAAHNHLAVFFLPLQNRPRANAEPAADIQRH